MRWLLVLLGYGWLGGQVGLAGATVVLALAALVVYLLSLRTHPHSPGCRRCHGSGEVRHPFIPWATRPCPRCGGRPVDRRRGVMVISPNRPVWAETVAATARNRRNRTR